MPAMHQTQFASAQLFSSNSSALNLRRLFALRNFIIAVQIAAIFAVIHGLGVAIPLIPLGMIIGAYAFLNALTWLRFKSPRPV